MAVLLNIGAKIPPFAPKSAQHSALVQFRGIEELIKKLSFKNVLKKSIGKTLQ